MAKGKKYDYRVVENSGSSGSWTAEIVRRASSKKTVVSKSHDGFATESEAQACRQNELKSFLEGQEKRNKRRALHRK